MQKDYKRSQFLWNAVGTAINAFMSFLYMIMISRINGVESAGGFSVCFSLSIVLYTVMVLGNRVYEIADTAHPHNTYFGLKGILSILAVAAAIAVCFFGGYSSERIWMVLLLMAARSVEAFSDSIYAVFQQEERLDLVGKSYTIKNTAALAGFAAADLLTHNLIASTMMIPIATVLTFFFYDRMLVCRMGKNVSFCFEWKAICSLFCEIVFFMSFNIVLVLIANTPRFIADRKFTETQMGYVGILMMIPTVMSLMGQIIYQPIINGATNDYHNKQYPSFRKKVLTVILVIAAAAVVASIAAFFLGPPILGFIMGVSLMEYASGMVLAILAGLFITLTTFLSMILTIMGRTSQQLVLHTLILAVEIIVLSIGLHGNSINQIFVLYGIVMSIQFLLLLGYWTFSLRVEMKQ